MTRTALLLASAFSLAIVSTGVPALERNFDLDGDGVLAENEFRTGFREKGVFQSWDTDRDGRLSEDEFDAGVFQRYDRDRSGVIEEPELGDVGDDMGDGGFWDV